MIAQTLRQEVSALEANFCSALSDPTRILVLYILQRGPRNVTDLTREIGATQPTISRHLKVLRDRGLVETRREGTTVTYSLTDVRMIQALDLLRAVMRDRLARQASLVTTPAEGASQ